MFCFNPEDQNVRIFRWAKNFHQEKKNLTGSGEDVFSRVLSLKLNFIQYDCPELRQLSLDLRKKIQLSSPLITSVSLPRFLTFFSQPPNSNSFSNPNPNPFPPTHPYPQPPRLPDPHIQPQPPPQPRPNPHPQPHPFPHNPQPGWG